jgi:Carboxypeptidase regulatory-like domain
VSKRSLSLLAVAVLLLPALAFAQGGAGSTGTIQGEVTDSSGAVLPGVAVTATSAAQIGSRTAVTNAQGVYRLPGLPAGAYKLTFDMQGFGKVVRDDVRVGVGFTATADASLALQTMQEAVTVVGESTTIDTTANRVQTNFDQSQLDSLPNARDMWSLLAETPAVTLNRFDVGGSTAGTQTTYIAYGNGGQNRPLIEGINTTEGTSAAGFYFDYGSFGEVFVGAAGNSAEMPSGGVLTQFIGKSGGNQFSGQLLFEYENDSIQSTNISQDQLDRGYANYNQNVLNLGLKRDEGNRLSSYKNFNASVGGPVIKDKLWWYFGFLRQKNAVAQPANGNILDGSLFPTELKNYTGKLTYQMTSRDRFIAYLQYGIKNQPLRVDSVVSGPQHLTKDSTLNQSSPSWVAKMEYNRTFGDRGFLEVRAGEFGYNFSLIGNSSEPRREDRVTLLVSGGGRDWELDRRRKQMHGAYTFYKDNMVGGDHQFKVGGEIQHETGVTYWNSYYADNVVQLFSNGAASAVRLGLPVASASGLRNYGLFVNDTYTRKKLTLNLGLRFDRYRAFLPEQDRPASRFSPEAATFAAVDNVKSFNHIAPRLGVTYDIRGNGKTVLKGSYGRYYFNPGVALADAISPNPSTQYTEYAWTDRNGDRLWQDGEQGAVLSRIGGASTVQLDPNLKNSYTDEFTIFAEQELPGQVGIRAGYVQKMDRNGYQQSNANRPLDAYNVPVTVTDNGPDGVANTGDESQVAALNLNAAALAAPIVNRVFNPDGFEADYKSIEVALNKRFSRKWGAVGSFVHTWTDEYSNLYYSNTFGVTTPLTPSLFGGNSAGGTFPFSPNDRTHNEFTGWTFKISGSYEPGWGLRFTPIFRAQAGQPYGRFIQATLNYGSQPLLLEPIGTRRQDTISIFDIRAEKKIKITNRAAFTAVVDVYNVFNSNVETNIRWTTGTLRVIESNTVIPTFGTPLNILPPRILRFSARFDW